MSTPYTCTWVSASTGVDAEFVDRRGTHQIVEGGGVAHLSYGFFQTITEMGSRHQIVSIRCTCMYVSSRHWYHLLFSKLLLQQYVRKGYRRYRVTPTIWHLSWLFCQLSWCLHCYNRGGWENTTFVRGCENSVPPTSTQIQVAKKYFFRPLYMPAATCGSYACCKCHEFIGLKTI